MSTKFEELERLIAEKTGSPICPICGTPYIPYNSRQRTCGTEECKREWKNKYLRERRNRLIAEDKAAFNHFHAEAQRKSRQKKKQRDQTERNYERIREHWERVAEFDKIIAEHGLEYGKYQMEKTLALVPKIDVNLDRGKKNDDLHNKNE